MQRKICVCLQVSIHPNSVTVSYNCNMYNYTTSTDYEASAYIPSISNNRNSSSNNGSSNNESVAYIKETIRTRSIISSNGDYSMERFDSTTAAYGFSTGASFLYQVVYVVIGCFGLLSNLFVFLVIVLYKPMHKQLTNIYIANQSLLDAMVSLMLILSNVFQDDGTPHRYNPTSRSDYLLCAAWYSKMPLWCMVEASTYSIVALTYERYLAVLHPIWYKTKFATNRWMVGLSIAFLWLVIPWFSVSYNVPTSGVTEDGACSDLVVYPSVTAAKVIGVMVFCYELLFPAILIIHGYARIAFALHKRVETSIVPAVTRTGERSGGGTPGTGITSVEETPSAMKLKKRTVRVTVIKVATAGGKENGKVEEGVTGNGAGNGVEGAGGKGESIVNGNSAPEQKTSKRNESMAKARSNVLKTLALVGFFFLFCWSWNETYYLLFNLGLPMDFQMTHTFTDFTICIGFLNSCINPIIYSVNYTLFRRGVVEVFCGKRGRRQRLNDNNMSNHSTAAPQAT